MQHTNTALKMQLLVFSSCLDHSTAFSIQHFLRDYMKLSSQSNLFFHSAPEPIGQKLQSEVNFNQRLRSHHHIIHSLRLPVPLPSAVWLWQTAIRILIGCMCQVTWIRGKHSPHDNWEFSECCLSTDTLFVRAMFTLLSLNCVCSKCNMSHFLDSEACFFHSIEETFIAFALISGRMQGFTLQKTRFSISSFNCSNICFSDFYCLFDPYVFHLFFLHFKY